MKKPPPNPAHVDEVRRIAVEALRVASERHPLRGFMPIEIAMGLAYVAVEQLYHDGAGEQDAKAVMAAAWRRVVKIHQEGGCRGVG